MPAAILLIPDERCPECDCASFARIDERKPSGGFGPGPLVRCVHCKREFYQPEAGPLDPVPVAARLRLEAGPAPQCTLLEKVCAAGADALDPAPRLLRALTAMLEETEGTVTVENRGLGLARYQALEAIEAATGKPFMPTRRSA